jgi:hypothetical protein
MAPEQLVVIYIYKDGGCRVSPVTARRKLETKAMELGK